MKDAYPELEIQRDFIGKMVRLEEERFGATMTVGLKKLDELLSKNDDSAHISIRDLAKLYDTFGTPIDLMFVVLNSRKPKGNTFWTLTKELGEPNDDFYEIERYAFGGNAWYFEDEQGVVQDYVSKLTEQGFQKIIENEDVFREVIEEKLSDIQQQGEIGKTKQADKINPIYVALERTSVKSNFHGYDKTEVEGAKVLALVKNDQKVDELE